MVVKYGCGWREENDAIVGCDSIDDDGNDEDDDENDGDGVGGNNGNDDVNDDSNIDDDEDAYWTTKKLAWLHYSKSQKLITVLITWHAWPNQLINIISWVAMDILGKNHARVI